MQMLQMAALVVFQSTHPARGATPHWTRSSEVPNISIHAPREGCDPSGIGNIIPQLAISIHAPREGCDATAKKVYHKTKIFQSTHPARGATSSRFSLTPACFNFNPRTPRGVRRGKWFVAIDAEGRISIHAPREGCDYWLESWQSSSSNFNPRTPRGVRPIWPRRSACSSDFNPRTPRGVRLFLFLILVLSRTYFNPRTPRGVRLAPQAHELERAKFQSTHPARGAT